MYVIFQTAEPVHLRLGRRHRDLQDKVGLLTESIHSNRLAQNRPGEERVFAHEHGRRTPQDHRQTDRVLSDADLQTAQA